MREVSDKPSITVLICALNEEKNLPYVLPTIPEYVDEILLVDGHSTDRTAEVARELRSDILILCQPNKGKDDALRYGIKHAKGDIIITLDADGSTDPAEIQNFIRPLIEGYDYAKGSRFLNARPQKMRWYRRLGNWVLATEANFIFGTQYTDLCSGYSAFWKSAWERIYLPEGFGYEPMITLRAHKAGLKIIEVPCIDKGRVSGYSKLPNWKQGWGAFKAILKERFCD